MPTDLPQKTTTFTQDLVDVLKKILGPFALPGKKAIRDDYFTSLGLDPKDTPEPNTDKIDSFTAKKAEEADELAFAEAVAQLNTIIVGIEDVVISAVNASSFKQGADDIITALLNMLTIDYMEREHPVLHNIFFMLQTGNNFANRGGGSISFFKAVGNYFELFGRSHNLENADEARRLGEVYFFALTAGAYILQRVVINKASLSTSLNWLVGGQFGFEGDYVTDILPIPANAKSADIIKQRRQDASQMLNRMFAFSVIYNNGLTKKADDTTLLKASFGGAIMPLAITDNGRGVHLVFDGNFKGQNLQIADNWFLAPKIDGHASFRIGGDKKTDTPIDKVQFGIALERLFNSDEEIEKRRKIVSVLKLGLGNLSFQIDGSLDDLTFTIVADLVYSTEGAKKKGFPLKHLPEKKDKFKVPIRFSIKNGFGFKGDFISTTPPPKEQQRELLATPSVSNGKDHLFTLPIHKSFSFGRLDKVQIGFGRKGEDYAARLLLDFTLNFSDAVVISVTEIGIAVVAKKRTSKPFNGGFMGYDLKPAFVPPKGVGILIDAVAVKGGGFLKFDEPRGEYFGAIELSVRNLFDLKAIGIIRTRDDAGKEQFSLFILITAEFTPIQLGLGFTLNGVGGMLALNRRANVAYLQENLSNGVLDSILFPRNVIANMSRIISNLTTAFPIQDNRFAVGLMAKIGWGAPQIVSLDLGIIVEFPDTRILLPGILRINFPNEVQPIVSIKAAFLGILDFKNKFAYFRAELINSSILTMPLSGSMAFGICWGDSPVFVFSAGGFHPRFHEIPSLPTLPNAFKGLNRLRLQFLDIDNPRIIVESYIAATSNTVQFGGKIEFFYDVFSGEGGYNVYGRLQADTLIQFDPFHFIIDIAADLALRDGSETVMGISISGTLEGPTPWHISVTAHIELFLFSHDIDVDKVWGNRVAELPSATAKVADLLRGAVQDVRNWQTLINNTTNVSLRKESDNTTQTRDIGAPKLIRLDPSGGLKFSQSIVPLDFDLKKFGNQQTDLARASIGAVQFGNTPAARTDVRDFFAPEMFTPLNDDERLSRPSYERMKSGFELANSDQLKLGDTRPMPVIAEVSEANRKTMDAPNINMNNHFRRIVRNSSATFKSEASLNNRAKKQAYQHLEPTTADDFVITQKDTMAKAALFQNATFGSFAEADNALRRLSLAQRKDLQVVNRQELV